MLIITEDMSLQATLSDALAVLKSSPMIFALCLMVISYGVGHRLFEFAWKGQLRMQYPSALAYQVFQCLSDTCLYHEKRFGVLQPHVHPLELCGLDSRYLNLNIARSPASQC